MPKKSAVPSPSRNREVAKPPILMERTQPVIERLSAALGEPVFTYWNSTKGAICQNDVAGLYALISLDGESTWLEGLLLCAFYLILAVGTFFTPA